MGTSKPISSPSPTQKKSVDSRDYTKRMKELNTAGNYAEAIKVFDEAIAAGVTANVFLYSSVFSSLRKAAEFKRARELALEYLSLPNNQPNPAIDRQIFDIFCRSSDIENAKSQLEHLKANSAQIWPSELHL